MTGLALVLVTFARVPADNRQRVAADLASATARYALSAFGPVSVSAAHFIAALIFLHTLPRAAFGLFSFLLVVAPFALSLCGAMFAPPIAREAARPDGMAVETQLTLFKANLAFSAAAGLAVAAMMAFSGAGAALALVFGLYGSLMSARWFARCWTYAERKVARVLASDLAYSGLLATVLLALLAAQHLTIWSAAITLLAASVAGLAVFDAEHLRRHWRGLRHGKLGPFAQMWREISGWAVLGVVLSETTVNAHAYLVTFISGPRAFAVLAIGTLLMRPVSLVLTALPDMERPLMSRALRACEPQRAFRIVKEFRTAAGAIWLATILLAAALLLWFPHLVLKKEYPLGDVAAVVGISAAIMALRSLRTPDSVLLQAAGEFRALAGAGAWSSIVSLVATFGLLMLVGPIAALGGILIGDIVATERTFALARRWRRSHA